jgi:hypothetical protein
MYLQAIVGLVACLFSDLGWGCSPPMGEYKEPTLAERAESSGLVFYGVPVAHYQQTNLGSEAYTAKMNVYCVLKGPKTTQQFNVTEAGGSCLKIFIYYSK